MSVPSSTEMDALEAMVDKHGLYEVLVAMAVVCGDKADHVQWNYQDVNLARKWNSVHNKLQTLALAPVVEALSP